MDVALSLELISLRHWWRGTVGVIWSGASSSWLLAFRKSDLPAALSTDDSVSFYMPQAVELF